MSVKDGNTVQAGAGDTSETQGNSAELKLVYGVRDSIVLHVSEVESGLACSCTCPGCGAKLVAKKGEVQRHHFAHAAGADCATGLETGLHLAAKAILTVRQEIRLPAAEVQFPRGAKRPIEVAPTGLYSVSNVRLETSIGGLVPDILLEIDGRQVAIEVFVTHRVDDEKKKRLRALGLSTLEIDLSKAARDLDPTQLEAIVIDGIDEKRWLYHAEVEKHQVQAWAQAGRIVSFPEV